MLKESGKINNNLLMKRVIRCHVNFQSELYFIMVLLKSSWTLISSIAHTFTGSGQQIRSKIESFQNSNFLISQPNAMMFHPLESSRRDDFNEGHIIGFG